MRHRPYAVATLTGALVASLAVQTDQTPTKNQENHSGGGLIVYVAGEGVPEGREFAPDLQQKKIENDDLSCQGVSDDAKEGFEMWAGAQAAWSDLHRTDSSKPQFSLMAKNDEPSDSEARDYKVQLEADPNFLVRIHAEELLKNPAVLAVIGYPKSGATQVAGQVYSRGGIPLIIPVATAEIAVQSDDNKTRLTNCFRLPPSDNNGQAQAIAHFINQQFKGPSKHVHMVTDDLVDHGRYSDKLCGDVARLLENNVHTRQPSSIVDSQKTSQSLEVQSDKIAKAIKIHQDEVVVFCGYSGEGPAKAFFEAMSNQWIDSEPRSGPILIFTDAAVGLRSEHGNIDNDSKHFKAVYLADFYNPEQADGESQLKDSVREVCGRPTAAPIFAYDAVLIIHEAIELCSQKEHQISRECLRRELELEPSFAGVSFPYTFQDGQNVFGNYYLLCFGNCAGNSVHKVSPHDIVSTRLRGMRIALPEPGKESNLRSSGAPEP